MLRRDGLSPLCLGVAPFRWQWNDMARHGFLSLLPLTLLLANAEPGKRVAPLPAPVQSMLDAALASGNEGEVNTVAKYARAAAPDSADLIDATVSRWRKDRADGATRHLREATLLELVRVHAELGGTVTTGNSETIGLSGLVKVSREGLNWRHKLTLQADYQETAGVVSRERYLAAYEPNLKMSDRGYIYGAFQYESDRFLGYYDRYSVSSGAGYSVIKRPAMKLDLEIGPAFRSTAFTDGHDETNVAGRGSVDFGWALSPGVKFSQTASAYLQDANSTVASKTALNVKVIGPLSTQLSYAVQFESLPPVGRKTTDTTTRAALVMDF